MFDKLLNKMQSVEEAFPPDPMLTKAEASQGEVQSGEVCPKCKSEMYYVVSRYPYVYQCASCFHRYTPKR